MNLARDIGRAIDTAVARTQDPGNWATIPLLADPRNDAHALISQTTALFLCLHNTIMQIVDPPDTDDDDPSMEDVYRRFLCARMAVTLIYRAIIVGDVLPRLLHPSVKNFYFRSGKPDYGALKDTGAEIPVDGGWSQL